MTHNLEDILMRNLSVAVLAATLWLGALPAAADVQVSYLVNDKALKGAVSGTPLTIDLFSDPACATIIGNASIAIDDVDLVERVKRFTPKGGVKAAATARLTEAIPGISPPPSLFAVVTGTGVTPVGGSCQPQYASGAGTSLPCATQVGTEVYFTGCNVNVRNGAGATDNSVNGLGNLIVGYNENAYAYLRNGAHNLVVGRDHGYANVGGFVAGTQNQIAGRYASIAGGFTNTASGYAASVAGGRANSASGFYAAISGGLGSSATGSESTVSGGFSNTASGAQATVSGGRANRATGPVCTVSGGYDVLSSGQDDWDAGRAPAFHADF